jgi:serine/threonine protein kinase
MEKIIEDFILNLNSLFQEINKTGKESHEGISCNYCRKSDFIDYRYKCLECDDYDLCSDCFEKRRVNYSHEIGHKLVRYDEPDILFGSRLDYDEVNLNKFKQLFKDVIHEGIKCSICNESIKGLRYKCDICIDFNCCEKCSNYSHGRHFHKTHPLLAIGITQSCRVDYDKIKLGKLLANRAFEKIYLAEYNQKMVACKCISDKSDNIEIQKSYSRELEALKAIKCDNVLKLIGYSEVNDQCMLLTEFMEKGNLGELIKNEPLLAYNIRLSIATNITAGLVKIHKVGFIHRDIRPDNILIGANYVAKIGDMSLVEIYKENTIYDQIGCIDYMAPEFYTGKITQKLDVFTFGLTLNKLFKGEHVQKDNKILVTRKCDFIFNSLVESLIRINPNERPESKQIDEKLHYIHSSINKAIKTDTDEEFLKSSTILTTSESDEKFYTNFRSAVNSFDQVKMLEQNKLKKERFNKLVKYFEQEISEWEGLNAKDPRILFYMEAICCVYHSEKDPAKCLEKLKAFMEKTEELFPGNTVEKATSLGRAGFIHLFLIEDYQKAAEFYMEALEIRKKCLTEDDPIIAHTNYRLGHCYQRLNLIKQALEAFFKALWLRRKIYEEKSEFIVDTLTSISECYLKLNDSAQFTKYRGEVLEIKTSLFAAEKIEGKYKEVLKIRGKDNGRPAWHYLVVEDEEKYQKLKKLLAGSNIDLTDYGNIIKSGFGEDSPSYIDKEINRIYDVKYSSKFDQYSINGNLVKDLIGDNIENEDPVLNLLFESLKFDYNFYNGIENIEIVKDLLALTDYYYMKLNNAYCCKLLATRAREISLKLFDNKETEYSVNALDYLAGCYLYILKDFEKALELYNKVLEIRKEILEPNHPLIASTLRNLGVCYNEMENIKMH